MLTISIYVFVLLIWGILLIVAVKNKTNKLGKVLFKVCYTIFMLAILEIFSVGAYRIFTGEWAFNPPQTKNHLLYEHHPYLVSMPVPGISEEFEGNLFTHNEQGFRGKAWNQPKKGIRIAAIGGSTTYGIGVDDSQTWPHYLDSILGPEYEVLNLGMPGHSTVEHVILSSLLLPEYDVDLVVYHTGINDIGNMHVKNLQPDYSDFHAPLLFGATSQCYRNDLPTIGLVKFSMWILQFVGVYPICSYHQMVQQGEISVEPDEEAIRLYKRNLEIMNRNAAALEAKVLFVPQLLTQEAATQGNLRWWIPFVENESLKENLGFYNQVMQEVATTEESVHVAEILNANWTIKDFADPCHLNPSGNRKFGEILAKKIRSLDQETINPPLDSLSGFNQ